MILTDILRLIAHNLWIISLLFTVFLLLRCFYYARVLSEEYHANLMKDLLGFPIIKDMISLHRSTESKEIRNLSAKLIDLKIWMLIFFILTPMVFMMDLII